MEWFQNWVNQIIISMIICVIVELLLPESASKKYAKTVIGIYLLFVIISPIADLFQKEAWESFSIEEYFSSEMESVQTSTQIAEGQIEQLYQEKMIQEIEKTINEKGYLFEKVEIDIKTDKSYEIEEIFIWKIEKKEKTLEGMPVSVGEKNILKQVLFENYAVSKDQIYFKG